MARKPEDFGRYRLLVRLAVGGMGEVYLARFRGRVGDERLVVVKRILPHLTRDPDFVDYFVHEGRLASLLNHPNIVHTYELGQTNGQYFIVMEYVPGPTLVRLLAAVVEAERQLSIPLAFHLSYRIASALSYVHQRCDLRNRPLQIIHMDLAPHNIIVTEDGDPKLLDFGIAQARGLNRLHRNDFRGRSAYLAPEQLDGMEVDQRVDLFALGVIMHELVACRPLFRGKTEAATVTRILHARIPLPHRLRDDCPKQFSDVILRALSRDRDERYQSAEEVLADLDACIEASHGSIMKPTSHFRREVRSLATSTGPIHQRLTPTATPGEMLWDFSAVTKKNF